MNRLTAVACCAIFFAVVAVPVFAQERVDFFDALQQNLPQSTSTLLEPKPERGKAETVVTTSVAPVTGAGSYAAYDAGQEQWSGYIAGTAAVLAALVVAFALGFILTHQHHSSEDQS